MRRQPSRYPFPTIIFTADFIPGFFEVRYSSTDLLEKSGNPPNTKKERLLAYLRNQNGARYQA